MMAVKKHKPGKKENPKTEQNRSPLSILFSAFPVQFEPILFHNAKSAPFNNHSHLSRIRFVRIICALSYTTYLLPLREPIPVRLSKQESDALEMAGRQGTHAVSDCRYPCKYWLIPVWRGTSLLGVSYCATKAALSIMLSTRLFYE